MRMISKVASAATIAAIGLGASAAGASAYTVSGGAVNGTNTSANTFRVGGASGPVVSCSTATFAGNASGLAYVDVTPTYSGCTFNAAGTAYPATVSISGPWRITPTAGTAPNHTGTVSILSGSTATVRITPIPSCTITVSGVAANQNLAGISSVKPAGFGERISAAVSGVTNTVTSGCPGVAAGTRADATYSTGSGYIQSAAPITIAP